MAEESKNGKAAAPALKLDVEVYNAGAIVDRGGPRTVSEQQAGELLKVLETLPKGGVKDSTLIRVIKGEAVLWEEWRRCGALELQKLFG